MEEELRKIKKLYGEKMMHLCRSLFPTILEEKDKLLSILEQKFYPSKYLYNDIIDNDMEEEFKNYIYSLFIKNKNKKNGKTTLTPQELLDKAGYKLFECHSEKDIQSFRHYYYREGGNPIYTGGVPESWKGEELCTFNGDRLARCHVFFAVRKDVDLIKRENFPNPRREDDYGVSVLSIQFSKGSVNTLSIKNRYNHTVPYPDSTFSNNLDNIIDGLTSSFEEHYNLNFNESNFGEFEIPGYVLADNGRFYKYSYEINNIYYCLDNIIIDNFEVVEKYNMEKERYLFLDYFILDLKEKKIIQYDLMIEDSFIDDLEDLENIKVNNLENGEKEIIITKKNKAKIFITIDKYSRIIKYRNDSVEKIGNYFLNYNEEINQIELPNVKEIGISFLDNNIGLMQIELPKVERIGNWFLYDNLGLNKIELPNVKEIGDEFLYWNQDLAQIKLPNVKKIKNSFLNYNRGLNKIELPNVKEIGDEFLFSNTELTSISLPKVKKIGDYFIYNNERLTSISLCNVIEIGIEFLFSNMALTNILLPNVKKIGNSFLHSARMLTSISLPNDEEIGKNFLFLNKALTSISLPNVQKIGDNFLYGNQVLTNIELPKVEEIGICFLYGNQVLRHIELPKVEEIEDGFLMHNRFINRELISLKNRILSNIRKSNNNMEESYDKGHSR